MKRGVLLFVFLIFAFLVHAQSLNGPDNVRTDPYPVISQSNIKATRWVWDSTHFSSYQDTKTGKKWASQRDEVFNPTVIIEVRKNRMTGALEKYDSIVQHFYGPDILQSIEKYPWCSGSWKDTIHYEKYTQDQKAIIKMGINYSRYYCKTYSGTKKIYKYSDNGRLFSNTSYSLDTSSMVWVKTQQTIYYYRDDGKLDSTVQQKWSETNNNWQDQLLSNYFYDSKNRLKQIRTQKIEPDGQLKDTLFVYYTYIDLQTFITYQAWDSVRNNYKNTTREVYIYSDTILPGDTLLIEYYTQHWDVSKWVNNEDYLYKYDSLKRIITKTKRLWSTNDNQWKNSFRKRYEYDENNLLAKYFQDSWFGTTWDDTYDEVYYYSQVQYNPVDDRSDGIKIYPNPAINYIRITGIPDGLVKIYNLSGQLIYQARLANDLLNISHLKPGIYIIQISNNKTHFTHNLIKQ